MYIYHSYIYRLAQFRDGWTDIDLLSDTEFEFLLLKCDDICFCAAESNAYSVHVTRVCEASYIKVKQGTKIQAPT